VRRLQDLIDNASLSHEYTLNRLIDKLQPHSTYIFPALISKAIEEGLLKKLIRVESPSLGGIDEFSSLMDIPNEIYDHHQGLDISVTPSLLKVIYKPIIDACI
jgi:hypothetical protein